MTPEERAMLTDLADKIARTPAPAHDPEADDFIRTNIGNRPDALYILTQTTLIQNSGDPACAGRDSDFEAASGAARSSAIFEFSWQRSAPAPGATGPGSGIFAPAV